MIIGKLLQGKLTYSALGVAVLVNVCRLLDIDLSEAIALEIVNAVALIAAIFGRWRATNGD